MEKELTIPKKRKRIAPKIEVIGSFSIQTEKIKIIESIIKDIGKFADEQKIKIYLVGGYVRDYYLDRLRTDFDFTVIGDAVKFAKKLAKQFKSKAVVFEQFGTAMVNIGDYKCEFVGTRKEEYTPDSRKPIVTQGTLEDDLKRRDFTVNAMAVSINQETFGDLIDLFNGKRDIGANVLRTPLDPYITFKDDPLRMMRAARFASQLRFNIDSACIKAIQQMNERINIISQERITSEFIKILESPKPSIGLSVLYETGLLKIIFPDLYKLAGIEVVKDGEKSWGHKDVFRHSLQVVDNVASQSDKLWLRFAALVHDIAKSVTKKYVKDIGWTFHGHEELGARRMEKIFREMKLPLEHLPYVEKLVRLHQRPMALVDDGVTDSAIRRLAFHAGDTIEDLFLLCRADITTKDISKSKLYMHNYDKVTAKVIDVQEKDKLREFQSPVRGEEIMEICNLEPSRAVGIIKNAIEEAILDGLIPNEYEPAKEYLINNKEMWLKKIQSGEWY
ncbi:HD domain-containing protein [Bacteroidetes/Chlorobi group bacterium ChocPot_Mid]|jgi:tRNA nucleotidyltransferase/poly(A) polymerase|nr:MAG: HD domain-containing protein [Bacteroidetes/Chlorobi group bacterium ChocPot_Mid]